MLDHKASLSKFKKIEIISNIFSNQNVMRLEISYKQMPNKHIKDAQHHQLLEKACVQQQRPNAAKNK